MSAPPWMPLYVAEYIADTGHLSAAEHGAYLMLIMHYWQNGELPDDDRKLARICRMSEAEWADARPTLVAFFDDGWHHGRIEQELDTAQQTIARRSAAGKAAASARHSKRNANAPSNAKQSHTPIPLPEDTELPNGSSAAPSGAPKRDAKTILFEEGLATLARLADRKPASLRPVIGRWMQRTGDDARAVLGEIARCRDSPVADPIASIEARLKPRDPDAKPRRTSNAEQAMSAMASAVARLNGSHERDADAPGERDGERGPGIGNPGPGALAAIPARHGAG